MILKKSWSSLHLLRSQMKRIFWMNGLFAIGLFFAMPVLLVNFLQSSIDQSDGLTEILAGKNVLLEAVVVFGALVAGLAVFAYLNHASQTDLYHALPVRRETLFVIRYVSGVISFLVPYCIMFGFMLLQTAMNGYWAQVDWAVVMQGQGILFLGYLLIYSSAVLAANLCGNLVISALGAVTFQLLLPLLGVMGVYYLTICFRSFYWERGAFFLIDWSPVLLYLQAIGGSRTLTVGIVLSMVVAILLMTLAALLLHKNRASEAAGHAIAFYRIERVIKYILLVVTTLVGGFFFGSLVSITNSLGWLIFGMVCGALLGHIFLESIFRGDVRGWKNGLTGFGIYLLVFAVVAVAFGLDFMGYDRYLPQQEQVQSVEIQTNALQGGHLLQIDKNPLSADNGITQSKQIGARCEDPQIVEAVLQLAELGVQNLESETGYPETGPYEQILIRYTLHDGRQIARQYVVAESDLLEKEKIIFENQEYREKSFPILSQELQEPQSIYAVNQLDYLVAERSRVRDQEQVQQVVEAYRQDFAELTWERFQEEDLVGQLFYFSDVDGAIEDILNQNSTVMETISQYSIMPIFSGFYRTQAVLEELNVYGTEYTAVMAEQVERIEFRWDGEHNLLLDRVITDSEEIAQELSRINVATYTGIMGGSRAMEYSGYYTLEITMKNGNVFYGLYRQDMQPEALKEAIDRQEENAESHDRTNAIEKSVAVW